MKATIRGKKYNITKEQIEAVMGKVEPDPGRLYFVKVQGKEFPIKQVIKKVTGLPMAGFNSQDAWGILTKLNYKIIEKKGLNDD